jgi:fatty-acyl-CoA synthase
MSRSFRVLKSANLKRKNFTSQSLESAHKSNFTPLTPLSFINRSATLFPDKIAWGHGTNSINVGTYRQLNIRCLKLAYQLLNEFKIQQFDVVSVISPNAPAMLEAHYGVPGARGILHCINIRLDAKSIAFQLHHAKTKIVMVDSEFKSLMNDVFKILAETNKSLYESLKIITINDSDYIASPINDEKVEKELKKHFHIDYDNFVNSCPLGDHIRDSFTYLYPKDEYDPIALNYTSGTTGN